MFELIKNYPAVYAVGDEYQITVMAKCELLASVIIDGKRYFDASNGILRSGNHIHKVSVPIDVLDKSKKYTLVLRKVNERLAYYSKCDDEVSFDFEFSPVEDGNINIYHICDCHGKSETPIKAAEYMKDMDLLILNGDMPNDVNTPEEFDIIHHVAGSVTKGRIPVVCARGNHDNRGKCAENADIYMPSKNGDLFYSFRVGSLWGGVLDRGEDRPDDFPMYGNVVCFTQYRQKQTAFLESIVESGEYKKEGITKRIVVCHTPFMYAYDAPFDVDSDVNMRWCELLREVKPHFMLSGHHHTTEVIYPGHKHDKFGQPCPIIFGSNPCMKLENEDKFIGCGINFDDEIIEVTFNDNNHEICGKEILKK